MHQPIIAITPGDPGGIGPEVIAKALLKLAEGKPLKSRLAVLDGEPVTLKKMRQGELDTRLEANLARLPQSDKYPPGKSTRRSARYALRAMTQATAAHAAGLIQGVATGPVMKRTLVDIGFKYPGQTEFFAELCGGNVGEVVMMMHDQRLTVALCSTHLPLAQAIRKLKPRTIAHVVVNAARFCLAIGKRNPRVAVAGVNPHAGENGLFGNEETRIIEPGIKEARAALEAAGLDARVSGPHSADTVFYLASRHEFDAVVCAYHDQGLIPFKLLAFSTGVNVSVGLPITRTSPDHGTGLDIAGQDKADYRSMVASIRLAEHLVRAKLNT